MRTTYQRNLWRVLRGARLGWWISNGLTAVEAAANRCEKQPFGAGSRFRELGESLLFLRPVIDRLKLASLKCGCLCVALERPRMLCEDR